MNESEFMQQLVDKHHAGDKVTVACSKYDDLMMAPPRLVDTASFNDKTYYVLECKRSDGIEIYGDFKYKGNAVPYKYGSANIWTLKI